MGSRLLPIAAFACVAFVVAPPPARAWGFEAHRSIMRRAIDLLPPELKPFFERHREEIVIRVTDPDLWRSVGWPEDPNHFLDFGVKEYGAYPFAALPRDYGAALAKFGRATLERNGTLPWRLQEISGNLRRAFEAMGRSSPNSVSDIILFSAVSAHYMQDAHQPLHATDNYDGGQTGQAGIHARFERELFERYQSRLTIVPAAPAGIAAPRDAAFDTLLASFTLVDRVLAADKQAVAGRAEYDAAYFDAFFLSTKSLLEQQLSRAMTATASIIIGAWEQAGKPAVKLEIPSPVQRVKPAR
jgi:hypothetical protein